VRHENSVLHDLLKRVPWGEFDRLVASHGADYRVRQLSTKELLIALLYSQLSGASSLREITGGLESHAARLYHVGGKPVSRTTLADANAKRPSAVFSELFAHMVSRAHRGLRRRLGEAIYLIDSTSIRLNELSADWARFSSRVCGAKLHVIYDPDADRPIYSAVTAANVNDITAAKAMPIEPGATYIYDLGYYDYTWWARLGAAGCRIVTRFKSNTPLHEACERAIPEGSTVLSDRVGQLPQRQARNRKNPFSCEVREIQVKTETGKILRILSNDLKAPAQEIADLYKRRWAIELFFRWIKQTLKISHFIGTSENAVRIQIAVALIAFLLLRLAQGAQKTVTSALAFARLVRTNLMHRKRIDRLLDRRPTSIQNTNQFAFDWAEI
jgi:hypothetical protein